MKDPNRVVHVYGLYDKRDLDQRVRYVGVTVDVHRRVGKHRFEAASGKDRLVSAWIRDVGSENLCALELEETTWDSRHEREIYWIDRMETFHDQHINGLNDHRGQHWSSRTKDRMSESTKKRWSDPDARAKWADSYQQTISTAESQARLSAGRRAAWQRPEYREAGTARLAASASLGGRKGNHTMHSRKGETRPNCEFCKKS